MRSLLAILIITLIYRLILISKSDLTFFSDDAIYAIMSRSCIEEGCKYLFHPFWPPLYPFLSSLAYTLVQNWSQALRIVSTIAAVLMLVPLYILVEKTISKASALVLIITLAVFSPLVFLSVFPLSDTLSTLFITCSLVSIFFGIKLKSSKLIYLGAIFTALIYLTRSEGTMFLFLYLSFLTV